MSSPITPSAFKALIPSVNGNFCQKFISFLDFPNLFYEWYASVYLESGDFTDEFIADICALDCTGTSSGGTDGTGGPGILAAPLLSATDGAFADKVELDWNAISGATAYDIYRGSVNNPATANLIAHDVTGVIYFDASVIPSTFYYYWIKAKNQAETSDFSNGDRGNAGAMVSTLAAATDLVASQGLGGNQLAPTIQLTWTPVAGAENYDIYRNTTDEFSTSVLIDSQRAPFDYDQKAGFGPAPTFIDNVDHLVYYHDPGDGNVSHQSLYYTNYYFWVVARRSGPAAVSQPSNSGVGAKGWAAGSGDGQLMGLIAPIESSFHQDVPSGYSRAWILLESAGGAGAGGDASVGGGGGGGGAIITGLMNVAVGASFRVRSSPESDTGDTPASTSGASGPLTILEYSANGTFSDVVEVCRCGGPGGGQYNAAGGGIGGSVGIASNTSLTSPKVWAGHAGLPAVGVKGGRGGCKFGHSRMSATHYNGYGPGGFLGWSGGGTPGSGSYSAAFNATYATGARGTRGKAAIGFKV